MSTHLYSEHLFVELLHFYHQLLMSGSSYFFRSSNETLLQKNAYDELTPPQNLSAENRKLRVPFTKPFKKPLKNFDINDNIEADKNIATF